MHQEKAISSTVLHCSNHILIYFIIIMNAILKTDHNICKALKYIFKIKVTYDKHSNNL